MKSRAKRCRDCGYLGVWPQLTKKQYEKLSELKLLSIWECTNLVRVKISQGELLGDLRNELVCIRHVWRPDQNEDKTDKEICSLLNKKRNCELFNKYVAGYAPDEHKELQRDATNRKYLLIGMIISAVIGATAAILATFLLD